MAVRFPKPLVILSQPWTEIFMEVWFGKGFPAPQTGVTNRNSIKYCRKTANINVKKLLSYNNV